MKKWIFWCVLGFWQPVLGQNLVSNPGFEVHNAVEWLTDPLAVSAWQIIGTPWLFTTPVGKTYSTPRNGRSYAGFHALYPSPFSDYRGQQYLIGQLQTPLKKDSLYFFEFYLKPYAYTISFTDRIGLYVGPDIDPSKAVLHDKIKFRSYAYAAKPQIESPKDQLFVDTLNWQRVAGVMRSKGNEQQFIIGKFDAFRFTRPNTNMPTSAFEYGAYFFLDDVAAFNMGLHLPDSVIICDGKPVSFDARLNSSLNASYRWRDGSTNSKKTVNRPGLQIVDITFRDFTYTDTVKVIALPTEITLQKDTLLCQNSQLVLNAGPGFDTYAWQHGPRTAKTQVNKAGIYSIVAQNKCGKAQAEVKVETTRCTCRDYVPNTFSPNGDGQNDQFGPFLHCTQTNFEQFNFRIMDRWGNEIFQSSDSQQSWDGKSRGQMANTGIYYWKLVYAYPDFATQKTQTISKVGTIALTR
jgi:gliding motility-associated-like protein